MFKAAFKPHKTFLAWKCEELKYLALYRLQELVNEEGQTMYSQNHVAKWLKCTPQTMINWKYSRFGERPKQFKYMTLEEIVGLVEWLVVYNPEAIIKFLIWTPEDYEKKRMKLREKEVIREAVTIDLFKIVPPITHNVFDNEESTQPL